MFLKTLSGKSRIKDARDQRFEHLKRQTDERSIAVKQMVLLAASLMLTVAALASLAAADVPHMINYQGRLTDSLGAPLDTTVSMTFTIYDDSTGGSPKWSETHSSVMVTSGLFSVVLGAANPSVPILDSVFNESGRYLGITVGSDAELSLRSRLVSLGYSHRVSTVDGAAGGTISGDVAIRGNVQIFSKTTEALIIELGEGLDYAEGFDIAHGMKVGPGVVLVIDPENPGKLTIANKPYDPKVAGIVAGGKGLGSGVRLGAGQYDYDVALAGRVYCYVDATTMGVEPGDFLTTSSTPGYAMKAADSARAHGAILGKAMERLEKGRKGQVLVLVTLQ